MSDIDIRNLIVESATKFFTRYGFHKTTMDEIAKNIHKAKGLLYYYFKSKEELFNEVLKQELGIVKSELGRITHSSQDPLSKLKDYILTHLRLLYKSANYHETLKADLFEKYHFVKDIRDDFVTFERAQLTVILEEGKNLGLIDIKDINTTVDILLMVSSGIEIPLYIQDKYKEYENTLEELTVMIVSSLRSNKK